MEGWRRHDQEQKEKNAGERAIRRIEDVVGVNEGGGGQDDQERLDGTARPLLSLQINQGQNHNQRLEGANPPVWSQVKNIR